MVSDSPHMLPVQRIVDASEAVIAAGAVGRGSHLDVAESSGLLYLY